MNGKHAYISQQQYIGVNCFLRIGSLPKQMIIETWIKVRLLYEKACGRF